MPRQRTSERQEAKSNASKKPRNAPPDAKLQNDAAEHSETDVTGGDYSQDTFEKHAALLGSPQLSHPANAPQRAHIAQRLQRDYGNAYVQRLVDHISRTRGEGVQRWLLHAPDLPWEKTRSIKTLKSGQPVFFFEDNTNDTIVVKGESTPIGMSQLVAMLHEQIEGTPSVDSRQLKSGDVSEVKKLINDTSKTSDPSWADLGSGRASNFEGNNPADKARNMQLQQLDSLGNKMQAMDLAPGKSMAELAAPGGAAQGEKTSRLLFDDTGYLQKLGTITAVDLFLENSDRVYSGNLGNWMTDVNGAITLIDNLDRDAESMWTGSSQEGYNLINQLAPSKLADTADECVDWLLRGMKNAGDTTAEEWAEQPKEGGKRRDFMAKNIQKGLDDGRKRIIKVLSKDKMKKEGRGLKGAAEWKESADVTGGNAPEVPYWERLKARARYLEKL